MHLHTHDVHNHFTCNSEWFSHLCIFVSFFFYLFLNASFYLPLSLSLDLYLPPSLICTSLCFSDEIYKTKFVRGTLDSMFSLFLFPIYKLYFLSVFLFLSLSHFLVDSMTLINKIEKHLFSHLFPFFSCQSTIKPSFFQCSKSVIDLRK